jgi:hypothetical protein
MTVKQLPNASQFKVLVSGHDSKLMMGLVAVKLVLELLGAVSLHTVNVMLDLGQ